MSASCGTSCARAASAGTRAAATRRARRETLRTRRAARPRGRRRHLALALQCTRGEPPVVLVAPAVHVGAVAGDGPRGEAECGCPAPSGSGGGGRTFAQATRSTVRRAFTPCVEVCSSIPQAAAASRCTAARQRAHAAMSLKSLIQQLDADGHRAEAALSLRRALALTPYDGELHDWHGVFAQDRYSVSSRNLPTQMILRCSAAGLGAGLVSARAAPRAAAERRVFPRRRRARRRDGRPPRRSRGDLRGRRRARPAPPGLGLKPRFPSDIKRKSARGRRASPHRRLQRRVGAAAAGAGRHACARPVGAGRFLRATTSHACSTRSRRRRPRWPPVQRRCCPSLQCRRRASRRRRPAGASSTCWREASAPPTAARRCGEAAAR